MTKDPQCCDAAAADECRCACHYLKPAVCSMCRRERGPMDTLDYSFMQVINSGEVGWYTGDEGEVCQECMVKILTGQGYGR